jgi:type VI secretion system secreted protein Hcp
VAVDYFLKFDPAIEGEATDSKHKGEIELLSWHLGVTNSSSGLHGPGSGTGKSVPADVSATKRTDKASARLQQAVALGDHFKTATLTLRKSGGGAQQEYLVYTFSDVYISSYNLGGSAGDELPIETLSFNYTKAVTEYKEQKADGSLGGSVKLGYDWSTQLKV